VPFSNLIHSARDMQSLRFCTREPIVDERLQMIWFAFLRSAPGLDCDSLSNANAGADVTTIETEAIATRNFRIPNLPYQTGKHSMVRARKQSIATAAEAQRPWTGEHHHSVQRRTAGPGPKHAAMRAR
jgi:hypothetical protein